MVLDDSVAELRQIAPDLAPSVARLAMPAYILDRNGVVRWLNRAALTEFGDLRGKRLGQIVAPEYASLARQEFAAKLLGTAEATEASVTVRAADGRMVSVDISSTQLLERGSIVGVAEGAQSELLRGVGAGRVVPSMLELLDRRLL